MRTPPNGLQSERHAADSQRIASETARQLAATRLDAWQKNQKAIEANARTLAILESERRYNFEAIIRQLESNANAGAPVAFTAPVCPADCPYCAPVAVSEFVTNSYIVSLPTSDAPALNAPVTLPPLALGECELCPQPASMRRKLGGLPTNVCAGCAATLDSERAHKT